MFCWIICKEKAKKNIIDSDAIAIISIILARKVAIDLNLVISQILSVQKEY